MAKKTTPVNPPSPAAAQEQSTTIEGQQSEPDEQTSSLAGFQRNPAQDDAPKPETHPALIVQSNLQRRFRIGRQFGTAPVTITANSLARSEIEALLADPHLKVKAVG